MEETAVVLNTAVVLGIVAGLGVVLKQVIDRLRAWFPNQLHDGWVQVMAGVIGVGFAWYFDLQATAAIVASMVEAIGSGVLVGREVPVWLDYIITGFAIAMTAGFFADRQKAVASNTAVVQLGEVELEG
jgi:uncharacterized membrane protein